MVTHTNLKFVMSQLKNRNKFDRATNKAIGGLIRSTHTKLVASKGKASKAFWNKEAAKLQNALLPNTKNIVHQTLKQHGANLRIKATRDLRDKLAKDLVRQTAERYAAGQYKRLKEKTLTNNIQDDMLAIVGPGTIENLAITHTTRASIQTSDKLANELNLLSPNDVWVAQLTGRTCVICTAAHNKKRKQWKKLGVVYENGPPAHNYCRCYIQYVNLNKSSN